MGKKSSTHTTITETVKTEVVKLTYLQTLAANQNLINVQDLNTEGFDTGQTPVSSSKKTTGFGLPLAGGSLIGLGKKKSSTTSQIQSSGAKVKDQWLQPYFDKIAYKIGIKELSVSRYTFVPSSEFTSQPYESFKEIVKVSLLVDEYVPPQFDKSINWIQYYVKVEGENEWVRINPTNKPTIFDEAGLIVPRILNYNLPKPGTAQIEDKYQYTASPVKAMRVRVLMSRPSGTGNEASMTPLLKSYRLIMIPKS